MVEVEVVNESSGCGNLGTDKRKLFRAAREPDSSCSPYCSLYRPRADKYDASVTFSVPVCLEKAVLLDDVDLFRKILRGLASNKSRNDVLQDCGTLQKAMQLNRSRIVSEIRASLS